MFTFAAEQKWCIDIPNSKISIRNTYPNADTATSPQLYGCNGTNAQNWIYDKNSGLIIASLNHDYCLDTWSPKGLGKGDQIKMLPCYKKGVRIATTWSLNVYDAGDNVALIKAKNSNLCLDLSQNNRSTGAKLKLENCDSISNYSWESNQIWTKPDVK